MCGSRALYSYGKGGKANVEDDVDILARKRVSRTIGALDKGLNADQLDDSARNMTVLMIRQFRASCYWTRFLDEKHKRSGTQMSLPSSAKGGLMQTSYRMGNPEAEFGIYFCEQAQSDIFADVKQRAYDQLW